VAFDIDANGIVNVSATDKGTGKEQQIRIQASGGLSDDDIDRMVKEAEEHAEEDKVRREEVEAKNHAEALVNQVEKSLSEHGDKVAEEEKSEIDADLAALKEALESDDAEAIKSKFEALSNSSMKLGEAIYKAEQAATEATAGDGSGPSDPVDDSIVDADFEEVKDEDEDDHKDQSSAS
ncbi:MAG: Hsp70 family protein, partial [Alphaproteobacteria bacterium]|nr:Hsp70 family protein [Alphaproteobacteria bacterium]